jgi:hypothetical protein
MDDDLTLHEPALVESVADDGTVLIHLIRPCVGRGRGRHLYEADMLAANAHKFAGWKMFVDHRSMEAQRKANGLPRSVRDLGGRIVESWWDPSIPASGRFGQGAVVGRAKPTPFIRQLVESDPELVETSINTLATGVRPVNRNGQRVNLVEGIRDTGSVDWVTEAGAGGKVVALMEAAEAEGDGELIAEMDDEEFVAYVEETRPGLTVALAEADDGDDSEPDADDDDEHGKLVKAYMKKGLPRNLAHKAAKRKLATKEAATEADDDDEHETEDGEMPEVTITPEVMQEAMQTPEFAMMIREHVEAVIADERDLIRAEARADADRQIELRDLRDAAREQIAEAKLPETLAAQIAHEFALVEGVPTAALDVVDEYDDEGNRTRTASQVLHESVAAAISEGRDLLAELRPTKITGVPASKQAEKSEGGEKRGVREATPVAASLMEAAGFTEDQVNQLWS